MVATPSIVLSFDLEEHYRIEAAVRYVCSPEQRAIYADRMEATTRQLLDLLQQHDAKATFFIVGEIAHTHPQLVRAIHAAGHEIASHSWDHQRVHRFNPVTFREDLLRGKDALEQVTGTRVVGFRAPTFSIVRTTGWALDVLSECGFTYDSSIFPVRHDRYGIHDAPRTPFMATGVNHSILELPLLTLRYFGMNLPVAGGGYFRLFPLGIMKAGIRRALRLEPATAMLYFHPWEFDPEQPRLPLGRLSRFRTYVGCRRSIGRLKRLLAKYQFRRAIDVANELQTVADQLPQFSVATPDQLTFAS